MLGNAPPGPTATLAEVARDIEVCIRDCPGIAGLDAGSVLITATPAGPLRGIRLREAAVAHAVELSLDVVGMIDAHFHEAASGARGTAVDVVTSHGWPAPRVDVQVTDVAASSVPLQLAETVAMPSPRARSPHASAPLSQPDRDSARARPAVEFAVARGDGRSVLIITIETLDE